MHEFGHAIGLMHSEEEGSIMNPHAPPFNAHRELGRDDILGVQSIYGKLYSSWFRLRLNCILKIW